MKTQHLDAGANSHLLFDASLAPALTIDSGDAVTFKTLDACWGEVRSIDDFLRYRAEYRRGSNPMTGPVFVRGARAGGTLRVDVLGIELDEVGFQLIGPNRAMIVDEVTEWMHYTVRVEGDWITVGDKLRLPADPIIGQLGNAPLGGATNRPNPCGGNLDCPFVKTGASVYLPVDVDGALFSVGDVHARQGDGEIVGAPEIGARVMLRLTYQPERIAPWPVIEDAESWHALASASDESEAVRLAVFHAAEVVRHHRAELSLADAMVLLTMTAKIHCCRAGRWGDHGPVVAVSVPKDMLLSHQPQPA
jgi:amidase